MEGALETLDVIRLFVARGNITICDHAFNQMLDRNISIDTVEKILCDSENQLLEIQCKSSTPGKEHTHDRYLIYAPEVDDDVIVVTVVLSDQDEVEVITAEHVDYSKWEYREKENPALLRK